MPPPSKGKPVMLVLLLLGIAGGAGLVTWIVVGREPAAPPPPPPRPPRPPSADLLVEPPPEPLLTKADASVEPDAGDAGVDAAPAKKRSGNSKRRYAQGTIDRRRVSAFIRSKQGQVRNCYERRLKVNNMLQGVLDTQITILPTGRVSNVNFTQDTLYDGAVKSCVSRVIRTWHFPEPEGGMVTVSNLFRFAPRH